MRGRPSALYAGQKNITARKIYNALETYVEISNGKNLLLEQPEGCKRQRRAFRRVRPYQRHPDREVTPSSSFLNRGGRRTMIRLLDEILSDATKIKISASYRLSEGSAWKDYADVTYTLKAKPHLHPQPQADGGAIKNPQFDSSILLNPYDDTNFDPDDESAIIDLYGSYQRSAGRETPVRAVPRLAGGRQADSVDVPSGGGPSCYRACGYGSACGITIRCGQNLLV